MLEAAQSAYILPHPIVRDARIEDVAAKTSISTGKGQSASIQISYTSTLRWRCRVVKGLHWAFYGIIKDLQPTRPSLGFLGGKPWKCGRMDSVMGQRL